MAKRPPRYHAEYVKQFRIVSGARLKRARNRQHMSGAELANAINVSHSLIPRWESGERGIELCDAVSIAEALDVSLNELALLEVT